MGGGDVGEVIYNRFHMAGRKSFLIDVARCSVARNFASSVKVADAGFNFNQTPANKSREVGLVNAVNFSQPSSETRK